MTALHLHIRAILCIVLLGLPSGFSAALAGEGFVPAGTLVANLTRKLPVNPDKVIVAGDKAYVIGASDKGDEILKLDAATLEIIETRALPFDAEDLIAGFNGKFVYVIGNQEGETALVVMGDGLESLGRLVIPSAVASPSLSLAENDILILAGILTEDVDGTVVAIDVTEATDPFLVPDLLPLDISYIGSTAAWLDNGPQRTVFLNIGVLSTIVAFGIGEKGSTEYSDISFGGGKGIGEPLTTVALMPQRLCRADNTQASFLIADSQSETLLVAGFDPLFKSLDVLGSIRTSLSLMRPAEHRTFPGTDIPKPTSLLASSCNQGVVWLGNLDSREIEQFAVNPELASFEKVGEIILPSRPNGLAISETGGFGLAISDENDTVMLFRSGDGGIIGSAAGRTLQRLLTERGYSVGAIDGLVGARTLSAVSRFEVRNDVQLDVNGDLEGALQIIQNTPAER